MVEFVGPHDCIGILACRDDQDQSTLLDAAERISQACFNKIEEFDLKKTRKKTIVGLGQRVREYKTRIATATGGNRKPADVSLLELDALLAIERGNAPGTSPGNSSIRSHFGRK